MEHDESANRVRPELELFAARLKLAIGSSSIRGFARIVNIGESTVRGYLSGGTDPGLTTVIAMAKAAGVRVEWLATGEGDMGLKGGDKFGGSDGDDGEITLVPRYDPNIQFAGESGLNELVPIDHWGFSRGWLHEIGVSPKKAILVGVTSDAMEPTLTDGSVVLVDTALHEILLDGIYVFRRDGWLLVKRVQSTLGGEIYITCDNKRYADERVPKEIQTTLHIIGRVIWQGRKI